VLSWATVGWRVGKDREKGERGRTRSEPSVVASLLAQTLSFLFEENRRVGFLVDIRHKKEKHEEVSGEAGT
jgi:hypothetical protein